MPSVAQLADRVCAVTGLSDTGSDRAQVVGYLDQAYATSVMEAGGYAGAFSSALTQGVADYTFGTAPLDVTDLLELRNLWISDGTVSRRRVARIPEHELMSLRQGDVPSATPLFYAVRGTTGLLLYPAPASGTTLAGSYLKAAPELVESAASMGQETTPSAIPSPFHHDVIGNKAMSLAMEFENRFEEAANYDAKWSVAMERLLAWVSRFGGATTESVDYLGYQGPNDMEP